MAGRLTALELSARRAEYRFTLGARLSTFTPWVLFGLIFPLVGAIFFGIATAGGVRQVSLLRYGEITGAWRLAQEATHTRVNNQPVMK